MGFLSNIQPQFKPSKNSTKGFYIGTPEAEGENFRIGQNLKDFYEDYNDITDNIKNGKFIISGRKGTGKSAYVRYITEKNGEVDEVIGREGSLNIKDDELLVFGSGDILMRCKIENMQAWELLSKDGVVLTGPDLEHGGVVRTIIAFYVYYR